MDKDKLNKDMNKMFQNKKFVNCLIVLLVIIFLWLAVSNFLLVHQPEGGLCPLIVLHVHDGVAAPAILRQKNRSANCHVMQNLRVITQIRDGFDVRHGIQPLSCP